jgi:hypothetical protein
MNTINVQMWIGLAIHSVVCMIQFFQPEQFLFFIYLFFLVLNLIGIILISMEKTKVGLYVFMAGCFGFIPIGLIGLFGARKSLDKLKREKFIDEINEIGNEIT